MTSWKIFDKISWHMTDDISSIKIYNEENLAKPYSFSSKFTQKILKTKVPVKNGDEVVIMSRDCKEPVFTAKITTRGEYYTVLDVMRAIYRGFNRIIHPGNRLNFGEKVKKYPYEHFNSVFDKNAYIYSRIAGYIDSSNRMNLIKVYEEGGLKAKDLQGDTIYFEGVSRRGNTKYLTIGIGS